MSAGLDVERVLAEHAYELQHLQGSICTCGFVPDVDFETLATMQDYHRAHVADCLREAVAAWVRGHLDDADYYGATEASDAIRALYEQVRDA